jgi:hypothetical protein
MGPYYQTGPGAKKKKRRESGRRAGGRILLTLLAHEMRYTYLSIDAEEFLFSDGGD